MNELKHILVVEDDDVVRKSLELMLRNHYDVHCEKYGKMAVSYLKCQNVDLILLDVNMPFLNGLKTLEKIRQIPEYELAPVVFLSAETSDEVIKSCFALGAKKFLSKPIEVQQLIETLDEILCQEQGGSHVEHKRKQEVAEVTRNFMPIAESVLLVGEDKKFLQQMKDYLKGYLPRLAVGKDEAFRFLDRIRPAVIYVEDNLASDSEFNMIRKMRMQPYAWKIPVVLFSQEGEFMYDEETYKKEKIDLILQETTEENVLGSLRQALS
jgi:CheY-like chemotaxis protein